MRHLLLLASLLLPFLACAEPLRVFVSVLPQRTFVDRVGGEHVEVQVMVGPGQNPAIYEPTPRQITALAKADLYVRTGVPFERAWMDRIRSTNADMRVLDARAGIDARSIEHHVHEKQDVRHSDADQEHGHPLQPEQDPHLWTSPPLVKHMTLGIRDALTALDPANGELYARNQAEFAAELDQLDRDIRALLAEVPERRFMVFHPAWGYFADTYGLTQVPIEKEGKEPGGRTLAAMIEQAKRDHIRVIFVQPQFDERSAQQVARAIGGRVVAIDPLSPDYSNNLREAARQIAEATQP